MRLGRQLSHRMDLVHSPVDGEYLAVRAAPGGRLSEGLVIDASILARLLGVRLLRLDARIRFVPAELATVVPKPSAAILPPSGRLDDAVDLLAHASRALEHASRELSSFAAIH